MRNLKLPTEAVLRHKGAPNLLALLIRNEDAYRLKIYTEVISLDPVTKVETEFSIYPAHSVLHVQVTEQRTQEGLIAYLLPGLNYLLENPKLIIAPGLLTHDQVVSELKTWKKKIEKKQKK